MPGGGAEIFAESVRRRIAKNKVTAEGWLEVHRTAHELGIPTNATMLYGHVETLEDRMDHMLRLRDLQDESPGFFSFIPLAFQPDNNPLAKELNKSEFTTGLDDLLQLSGVAPHARQLPAHQGLLDHDHARVDPGHAFGGRVGTLTGPSKTSASRTRRGRAPTRG